MPVKCNIRNKIKKELLAHAMFARNRHRVFLFVKSGKAIPGYLFYKTEIQSQIISGDIEADEESEALTAALVVCAMCGESRGLAR